MKIRYLTLKRRIILYLIFIFLFAINKVQGQSWSIEYVLNGDSSVYVLSEENIVQGKVVDFFFPAYKYYHTSALIAVESVSDGKDEIVELKFDSKSLFCDVINFEINTYAEDVDTIHFFLKTIDEQLIPVSQQIHRQGYTYLPTSYFSANIVNNDFKSIQIVGKSKNCCKKFIVGRVNGSKKIKFTSESMLEVDSFVSNYSLEKQSDTFVELPDFYLRMHGFNFYSRLLLKGCNSTIDSIQCISQYINKLLNDYELYDVYSLNKQELINHNTLLANTSNDIDSYYYNLKKIIASLNSCHMRLSTNIQDDIESPLQAIYFYNINNEIAVSAIFDPALENKIQLGDKLLSINNTPLKQLYQEFSKNVFASSSQQREIKITQKLLYLAIEIFGDNLLLEFQNDTNKYSIELNKSNFSEKKVIPSGFKILSDNVIEKYDNVIYLKPIFQESHLIPYLHSHKTELNNCDGLIIDFRGCPGGDFSFCTFFSYLISKNSLILTNDSNFFSFRSDYDYIVKPSRQINVQSPIVALIDARSTCAPELIINALRKVNSNIYVIGATNSAGSAQGAMRIELPCDAVMAYFEGITKDAFGNAIDNNIGVLPDIIVNFDSYKDLFPYNDKIKQSALKYLGYTIENIDESQF